jgi:hypothetical protein
LEKMRIQSSLILLFLFAVYEIGTASKNLNVGGISRAGETPVKPETPKQDNGNVPSQPETPKQDNGNVPSQPETPKQDNGNVPSKPETPKDDKPVKPDNGNVPSKPETPKDDKPVKPDNGNVPSKPDTPKDDKPVKPDEKDPKTPTDDKPKKPDDNKPKKPNEKDPSKSCEDKSKNCDRAARYCKSARLESTLRTNCQKTCGLININCFVCIMFNFRYCSSNTCKDLNPSCASWNRNGFCSSTFYDEAFKRQNCGVTCVILFFPLITPTF